MMKIVTIEEVPVEVFSVDEDANYFHVGEDSFKDRVLVLDRANATALRDALTEVLGAEG